MSDTLASLRRKISGAGDLQSVVRTMKAVAASSIGQYENAVEALSDYYHTVELGLSVCLRKNSAKLLKPDGGETAGSTAVGAVVFGSDQGLVGQFNDIISDFAVNALTGKPKVWAVGSRVGERLSDAGLPIIETFEVPTSINAVTPLVGKILVDFENQQFTGNHRRH